MTRTIISILGLVLAGAIFFLYTKPAYDGIQVSEAQVAQYNEALDKAAQLESLKETLLSKYNSFDPSSISRLQTMLPDQVNNIGLILDLDTLAGHYGMSLQNVDVSAPDSSNAINAAGSANDTTQKFQSLTVNFTVHGTYQNFEQFMVDLESSLRLVDLVSISVAESGSGSSSAGSSGNIYALTITIRTYWLK